MLSPVDAHPSLPFVRFPRVDLVNVFSVFLPQLLRYPNPSDPLNGEAAALLMKDPTKYEKKVREHVKVHASDHIELKSSSKLDNTDVDIDDSMSELSEISDMSDDEFSTLHDMDS